MMPLINTFNPSVAVNTGTDIITINGHGFIDRQGVIYHTGAGLGGTATFIAGNITIPAFSTLNVIDRGSQYYLEENTSIGAQAGSANALGVTVSYEDIS
jgi:hypothetical protein